MGSDEMKDEDEDEDVSYGDGDRLGLKVAEREGV